MRAVRRLGARGRRRPAHLLRTVRPAAPRAGVGRDRGERRHQHPRLQGPRARGPGVQRGHAHDPARRPRDRAHAVLDDRVHDLGQRAAGLQDRRRALRRPGPQRQPREHGRDRHGARLAGHGDHRLGPGHDAARERGPRHRRPGGGGAPRPADPAGGLQLRVHGRAVGLRRPGPARRPAAVDRAPAERVRGRVRDLRPRHRGRRVPARRRAGRARPDRRPRAAQRAVRRVAAARALHLRVRVPRAARLPPRRRHGLRGAA